MASVHYLETFCPLAAACRAENNCGMSRTTATFSISLPPEMANEVDRIRKEEHRTRSELIREALRRYFMVVEERDR